MTIYARIESKDTQNLFFSTGEFFDSLMYGWSVSGSDTGNFMIYVTGYFAGDSLADSVSIRINSAFATGWPQSLSGSGAMTAICCDLNRDGIKEIAVGTRNGLILYRGDNGSVIDNFPVLPEHDMRSVPAVYDVDHDGQDEIICTNNDGIHVFNYDGSYANGWPRNCYTGLISYQYAYPNPVVTQLRSGSPRGATPDSGIIIINKIGQILAFRFNGDSYFYSMEGLFSSIDPRLSESFGVGGGSSPFVTAANLDSDGSTFEVIASYTSPYPYTGIGLFQGANGEPYSDQGLVVQNMGYVFGSVLADLNGDSLPEVISAGWDSTDVWRIWAKTNGSEDLPGWPVDLPTPPLQIWIGSYPTAADLDLDGIPEVLITVFEYDIAALCIYNADGTPYIEREGRPPGEAFLEPVTFGTPVVANITGDDHPEIIFRSGYILPGTGNEQLFILDYQARPLPGWPIATPARPNQTTSSRFVPLVDDVDNDGLVELVLISDADELLVWNFGAEIADGYNTGRFLMDNHNSSILPPRRIITDVNDPEPTLPIAMELYQNYPNPFNPSTVISFNLPTQSKVKITVYNILGRQVSTLLDREMTAGNHEVEFDGSGLATGVYFYRLQTGESEHTRKMMLVK